MTPERSCPNCSLNMEYRLGEFTCSQCGHREEYAPPDSKDTSQPGGRRFSGGSSAGGDPKNDRPGYSRIGLKLPAESSPGYSVSQEKALYLAVFFVMQVITGILLANQYEGTYETVISLPGLMGSALFMTFGVGCVFYVDSSLLRQSCLVISGLLLLLVAVSIFLAFRTDQAVLTIQLIPNLILVSWLVSILMRDDNAA